MVDLNLIPLPANSKACKIQGWQKLDHSDLKVKASLKAQCLKGNVGWVVPPSMMVLDIDTKYDENKQVQKVGDISLAELEAKYGKLPECPTQRTASGGLHLVFSLPEGVTVPNSASKVGKDLDIKSGGNGYIVVEPSTIDGESYTWIKDSPNDSDFWKTPLAPSWLITLAKGEGQSIKPSKIIAPSSSLKAENQDVARIRSVLAMIPSDKAEEYDSWIKVGLALSNWSAGSELGLSLWDDWSRQASSFDEGECAKRWAGFTPNQTNGVTVSSLFFMAKSLPLNDEGLVARLANLHGENMKFCPGIGWLRFRN
jgi:hypothetical protein